jgi:hypothetical protein
MHLSAIKKLLLLNFLLLLIFQIVVGFKDLDDYLVIFVFVLFLNDLYFKLNKPMPTIIHEEKRKRIWVSMFLLLLILTPFLVEYFHVKSTTQLFICKVGLILWSEIFLLDTFLKYRQTQSRKWLLFANLGGIFVLFFSIII